MSMTKMLKQAILLIAVKACWQRYELEKQMRAWRQKAQYIALIMYLKLGRPLRKNGNITRLLTRKIQGAISLCASGMAPYIEQFSAKQAMMHVFYMQQQQALILKKFQ